MALRPETHAGGDAARESHTRDIDTHDVDTHDVDTHGAGGHETREIHARRTKAREAAPHDSEVREPDAREVHERLRRRYRRLLTFTIFLTFDLIIFGAFVRLVDAGLGCPDWPGCYGKLSPFGAMNEIMAEVAVQPDGPVTVFKAWVEMLHRYIATGLGMLVIALVWLTWRWRRQAQALEASAQHAPGLRAADDAPAAAGADASRVGGLSPAAHGGATHEGVNGGPMAPAALRYADGSFAPSLVLAVFTLAWIILQGMFGMWTVTLKLMPLVVTLHLLGAMILFMALMAQYNRVQPQPVVDVAAQPLRPWVRALLVLVVVQVGLGGWVSSNYAALACTDFPMCHASWWPEMDMEGAFELWRPLGMRADGNALDYTALTAIHYVHRLVAYLVFVCAGVLAWRVRRMTGLVRLSAWLGAVLVAQLLSGLANVFLGWPLLAALLHTAGAAALIGIVFMLDFRIRHADAN